MSCSRSRRRLRTLLHLIVGSSITAGAAVATFGFDPPSVRAAPSAAPPVSPTPSPAALAPKPAPQLHVASPELFRSDDGATDVVVYPPKHLDPSAPKPVTVMLHGMCDEPTNECPYFAPAVTAQSWLVCPRGGTRCAGGGSTWDGRSMETVEAAVDRVVQAHGSLVDARAGRTLIGFSLGGIVGMDLAHRSAGRYPRVILIAARIFPEPGLLRRQGVERLVLAAGDNDMMRWHMAEQARRTDRYGLPTRFISFGPVGHWFPPNLTDYLREALDWVSERDAPAS